MARTAKTTASRKAKGRNLQKHVRDGVLKTFTSLTEDDVKSAPMGTNGSDIVLSTIAKVMFPYDVECKNAQAINIWTAYEQSKTRSKGLTPLLVVKRNGVKPLVIMDFEHFMGLAYAGFRNRQG